MTTMAQRKIWGNLFGGSIRGVEYIRDADPKVPNKN